MFFTGEPQEFYRFIKTIINEKNLIFIKLYCFETMVMMNLTHQGVVSGLSFSFNELTHFHIAIELNFITAKYHISKEIFYFHS